MNTKKRLENRNNSKYISVSSCDKVSSQGLTEIWLDKEEYAGQADVHMDAMHTVGTCKALGCSLPLFCEGPFKGTET